MKVKMIEANMAKVFEESINKFCEKNINVRDIKYITSGSVLTGYCYSAMILYDEVATYGELMKGLDIDYERKLRNRETTSNKGLGGVINESRFN